MNAPQQIQLVIRVTEAGHVEVTGPIHNKMLCYGLLEMARDAIKEHTDKMARSSIVQVGAADPFLMKQRQNGGAHGG